MTLSSFAPEGMLARRRSERCAWPTGSLTDRFLDKYVLGDATITDLP
jgi:hypothetical protein